MSNADEEPKCRLRIVYGCQATKPSSIAGSAKVFDISGTAFHFGEAASGATLALFDYNLGKQIYNEIKNPKPCR
jgi:hypothetical protein